MQLSDFHYNLPQDQIALYPEAQRTASRLLYLDGSTGRTEHHHFFDITRFLRPEDLLVFNNTKVVPARLFGKKETGGKVELLIERVLNDREAITQIRASKSPKQGAKIQVSDAAWLQVLGREKDFYRVAANSDINELLEQHGHMPLPPYIQRQDEAIDKERYQTVYAKTPGAVAAPTAGLHFDEELLKKIATMGIETAYVTLHVGAGTFQPVRAENIEDHHMHSEQIEVSESVCEQIRMAKARGGRVIAVGTTSVRSLESAALSAKKCGEKQDTLIAPFRGDTDIYIYPGYQFNCVDMMITNFHLPESTLLMLVSAFATREKIMKAYQDAIDNGYRFFSYGDAMLIDATERE